MKDERKLQLLDFRAFIQVAYPKGLRPSNIKSGFEQANSSSVNHSNIIGQPYPAVFATGSRILTSEKLLACFQQFRIELRNQILGFDATVAR